MNQLKVLIAGATGCIGKALVPFLLDHSCKVTVLSRDKSLPRAVHWDALSEQNPDDYDAVINLAGENINAKRWNKAFKQELIDSRVQTTEKLIHWVNQAHKKIRFLNASAARSAYWGLNADECADENFINRGEPELFTNQLVHQWESVLQQAKPHVSVAIMRFGVVLTPSAGALKQIIQKSPFKTYAIIGSGHQPFVWVSIDDVLAAIYFLLNHFGLTGPFNVVSPEVISQAEFAKTFAKAWEKSIPIKMPALIAKLLFGEMASELLLTGISVKPKKLLNAGFVFEDTNLLHCLKKLREEIG